jgi:hypothetical protein
VIHWSVKDRLGFEEEKKLHSGKSKGKMQMWLPKFPLGNIFIDKSGTLMDFLEQHGFKISKWKVRSRPKDRGNHTWPNRNAAVAGAPDLRFYLLESFLWLFDSWSRTWKGIHLDFVFSRVTRGRPWD